MRQSFSLMYTTFYIKWGINNIPFFGSIEKCEREEAVLELMRKLQLWNNIRHLMSVLEQIFNFKHVYFFLFVAKQRERNTHKERETRIAEFF